jgi:NAD(P)-dependent dehydrogenase (short-subunit alcohol dehydrogenase family)
VATVDGANAIVQTALDAFGTVDICVNNAGQVRMQPFANFPDEHIATVISTQLMGTLNVGRAAWRVMQNNGGGRIINVSSGAGYGGFENSTVYSMAKAGVIGLTIAMANEGAPAGIGVNVIAPYAKTRIGTGFGAIPWSDELAEWLHPRMVAPLVAWLARQHTSMSFPEIARTLRRNSHSSVHASVAKIDCLIQANESVDAGAVGTCLVVEFTSRLSHSLRNNASHCPNAAKRNAAGVNRR